MHITPTLIDNDNCILCHQRGASIKIPTGSVLIHVHRQCLTGPNPIGAALDAARVRANRLVRERSNV